MTTCFALGEGCWCWRFGDAPDPELSNRVLAAYRDLKKYPVNGVLDVVPAYTELAVHFDPLRVDAFEVRDEVEKRFTLQSSTEPTDQKLHRFQVRYEGADLVSVAESLQLSVEEVIQRHTAPVYTIAMIGFVPHFPYCLGLDPLLQVPRRASPRIKVPAGSVALAGVQTGIYPQESPGGWNVIGTTDPVGCQRLRPGDQIQFVATENAVCG